MPWLGMTYSNNPQMEVSSCIVLNILFDMCSADTMKLVIELKKGFWNC